MKTPDTPDSPAPGQAHAAEPEAAESAPNEAVKRPSWKDRAMSSGRWMRAHKIRTALILAVAVIMLSYGIPLAGTLFRSEPQEVVTDYLEALLDRDVTAALSIAGAGKPADPQDPDISQYEDVDESLLAADAMSTSWQIGTLHQRMTGDTTAEVYASIAGPDEHVARATFILEDTENGWRITNPFAYAYIDVTLGFAAGVEVNGMWTEPFNAEGSGVVFAVFPGWYQSSADETSGGVLTMPSSIMRLNMGTPEATEGLAVTLQGQFETYLDECVDRGVADPENCPFWAESDFSADSVDAGRESFTDVENLAWEMVTYPELTISDRNGRPTVVLRNPGTVKLTATGIAEYGDDAERVDIAVECGLDMDGMTFTLTSPDTFEFTARTSYTTC